MKPLTEKQHKYLSLLSASSMGTGEIRAITGDSIDSAHSRLRGLEDKLMVRRIQQGMQGKIEWELTRLGRREINA